MNNQNKEYWKNRRAKVKHSVDALEDKLKKFQKVEQKNQNGMQHLINKSPKMREQRKEVKRKQRTFPKNVRHESPKLKGSPQCLAQ